MELIENGTAVIQQDLKLRLGVAPIPIEILLQKFYLNQGIL